MRRFTSLEKTEIEKLVRNGKSLSYISNKFGVGKTTIYYHMKKFNGKKIKPIVIDATNETEVGEFIGLFAGDGSYFFDKPRYIYRIRIHLNKTETDIIIHYTSVIENVFGKLPSFIDEKYCMALEIRSKDAIEFIKSHLNWSHKKVYSIELAEKVNNLSKNFLIGFLRGLVDSDGYVKPNGKAVRFGTTSKNLCKNFGDALRVIDVNSKHAIQFAEGKKPFHHFSMYQNDAKKFLTLVKPIKGYGHTGI